MFTYGCDPELFVKNAKGKYVSAHGLIPGTKEEPFKVPGGAVQVDGMAVEFNIEPVDNVDDWEKNISLVLESLRDMLPGCTLVAEPSARFTPKIWEATPDEAKELGCNPDFNAYTKMPNPRPNGIERVRGAGGHIHIGWRKEADIDVENDIHLENCRKLVKQLDRYVGIPSLQFDKDMKRRKMYGLAGAFRPKPYGVEYRTPSNFWALDPQLRAWIFKMTAMAVEHSLPAVNKTTPRNQRYLPHNYMGGRYYWMWEDYTQAMLKRPCGRDNVQEYIKFNGFEPYIPIVPNPVKEYACAAA